MSETTSSASSRRPCPTSQRGDSGSSKRSRMAMRARIAPTAYIQRQPLSKPSPASANGNPVGHGSAGVVSSRPSQIPSSAPRSDMMKITDVNLARDRRGAISPMNVLTIARSAPIPNPHQHVAPAEPVGHRAEHQGADDVAGEVEQHGQLQRAERRLRRAPRLEVHAALDERHVDVEDVVERDRKPVPMIP